MSSRSTKTTTTYRRNRGRTAQLAAQKSALADIEKQARANIEKQNTEEQLAQDEKVQQAVDRSIESLKQEIAVLEKRNDAYDLGELKDKGATEDQLAEVDALQKKTRCTEGGDDAEKESKKQKEDLSGRSIRP